MAAVISPSKVKIKKSVDFFILACFSSIFHYPYTDIKIPVALRVVQTRCDTLPVPVYSIHSFYIIKVTLCFSSIEVFHVHQK